MTSNYLSQNQLKGLLKTGDVILPGTDKSPSFSQTGCIHHVDRMVAYLSEDDLSGLQLVLGLFRWLPSWGISVIMAMAARNQYFLGPIGAGLRMLEIGVKGATMSLYYSNLTGLDYKGKKIFEIVGWDAKVVVHNED